jgi:hypothetical protein
MPIRFHSSEIKAPVLGVKTNGIASPSKRLARKIALTILHSSKTQGKPSPDLAKVVAAIGSVASRAKIRRILLSGMKKGGGLYSVDPASPSKTVIMHSPDGKTIRARLMGRKFVSLDAFRGSGELAGSKK